MNTLADQPEPTHKSPQKTGIPDPGAPPHRTYEFEPAGLQVFVFARLGPVCADGKPQRFLVARIFDPHGVNPSLMPERPLGVHAVAEICRLILSRQHLADPGLPPAPAGEVDRR